MSVASFVVECRVKHCVPAIERKALRLSARRARRHETRRCLDDSGVFACRCMTASRTRRPRFLRRAHRTWRLNAACSSRTAYLIGRSNLP